nr:hypothetical protein [Tanacetum cinerariifolium]
MEDDPRVQNDGWEFVTNQGTDNPHAHIQWFNKITSTLKYRNVSNEAIKLMLFPFSLDGAARIWLEKEPPRSILTWEDLVSKFVNHLFPPSKTTNLKNDITNFQQRFDESFGEAWDRFKDLIPADGNLLNRTPRDALTIIENKSKVRILRNKPIVSKVNTTTFSPSPSPDVTALTEIVKELVLMNKATQQATVKAIEETCVTCGGPHPYYECLATGGNTFDACAAVGTYNQGGNGYHPQGDPDYRANNQMGPPDFPPPNVQNNQNYNQNRGVTYNGPMIPPTSSPLPKEVKRETEATKDKETFFEDGTSFNREVACEEYAQEVLGFSDSPTSGNPTPSDPIIASSSPSFTPFEGSCKSYHFHHIHDHRKSKIENEMKMIKNFRERK